MDILPLPAELEAECAPPGREETASYAVGTIGLHANASSGRGTLIQTSVGVWRPLASVLSARGDEHLGIGYE